MTNVPNEVTLSEKIGIKSEDERKPDANFCVSETDEMAEETGIRRAKCRKRTSRRADICPAQAPRRRGRRRQQARFDAQVSRETMCHLPGPGSQRHHAGKRTQKRRDNEARRQVTIELKPIMEQMLNPDPVDPSSRRCSAAWRRANGRTQAAEHFWGTSHLAHRRVPDRRLHARGLVPLEHQAQIQKKFLRRFFQKAATSLLVFLPSTKIGHGRYETTMPQHITPL